MRLKMIRLAGETFGVSFSDADEIESLRRTDPQAALALARRMHRNRAVADGTVIHVPLYLADHALPPEMARMAERLSEESNMTTVTIGDQQIAADPRIAEEIGLLRAQLHDAYGATAGAALTADIAARRAPDTARGRYIQRLENAHPSPPNHG